MAIAMLTTVAEATLDQYDQVGAKLGIDSSPPEGLVVHVAAPREDGGFVVFEVWETPDAYERFSQERLGPAIAEVTEGQAGQPDRQQWEVHNVIKP
ncbi:MAG TPA: hypothetical protein VGN78_14855 [Solirubrobacteraceae bacterium]|jgi:hypothetical protein|nr:hypothetical protein [Solirubrobacteraceae bacterium]